MKFEKLSEEKFAGFKSQEIRNLNAILGGAAFTDNSKAQTHDEGHTTQGQSSLDNVVTSNYGVNINTDQQAD